MSVNVVIIGEKTNSVEYEAMIKLKEIIQRDLNKDVNGKILLYANTGILCQEVKEIDLVLIEEIRGYWPLLSFLDANNNYKKTVILINNLCTTIEIKRHSSEGVFRKGTDLCLNYGTNLHCVTLQSNKQKYSLMNFFKSAISYSPYISNLIWFTQLMEDDIHGFLSTYGKENISNIFCRDVSFHQSMQLIVWQNRLVYLSGKYQMNSNYENVSNNKFQSALNIILKTKQSLGSLTRKCIEKISNKYFSNIAITYGNQSMKIIRENGSGKTIKFINHVM